MLLPDQGIRADDTAWETMVWETGVQCHPLKRTRRQGVNPTPFFQGSHWGSRLWEALPEIPFFAVLWKGVQAIVASANRGKPGRGKLSEPHLTSSVPVFVDITGTHQ